MILGLPRGQYQWCYYDLAHGITVTAGHILEVVADMPIQLSHQGVGTFERHGNFKSYIRIVTQIKGTWRDDGKWDDQKM